MRKKEAESKIRKSKVMRCSKDGRLGSNVLVVNGETLTLAVKLRDLAVDIA